MTTLADLYGMGNMPKYGIHPPVLSPVPSGNFIGGSPSYPKPSIPPVTAGSPWGTGLFTPKPDPSPQPIGAPSPGYISNPILGGGGFTNPAVSPPRYGINPPILGGGGGSGDYLKTPLKGYGHPGGFGGGDVAPGGGFTNPRIPQGANSPYGSLANIYRGFNLA